jgi:hypothetical protein
MITVRPAQHSFTGRPIVEILEDGVVVGVIYPTDSGIKIVSAHITEITEHPDFAGEVIQDDGKSSWPPIPSVQITFKPSPYVITPEGIKKIKPH